MSQFNRQWGPQAVGGFVPTARPGGHWIALAVLSPGWLLALCGSWKLAAIVLGLMMFGAAALGTRDGRRAAPFADGRALEATAAGIFAPPAILAYALARWDVLAHQRLEHAEHQDMLIHGHANPLTSSPYAPAQNQPTATAQSGTPLYDRAMAVASAEHGSPGGHIGWDEHGGYIGAKPRGGMLIIGPPGSGKTAAGIIPSVIVAPGACVASSIKGDVMKETWRVRAQRGRVWHFDPGGGEDTAPGVEQARWSPLVSIKTWDDARMVANRLAAPALADADGAGKHFVQKARDWLETFLYAAALDKRGIGTVADWAGAPDSEKTHADVSEILIYAGGNGDDGAPLALAQYESILDIPDRERGGIASSLSGLMRIYGSVTARKLGEDPNFAPKAFVRSADTLYITASPDRQAEYAPLLAGLLEEIRYAVYARHRAEELGKEPKRPHATFVLDEANNTAPIPLPAIISEAGGQSLHIVVGIQDLSRARSRWKQEADGLLTLFPTKVVLNGVVEPYTLDALSSASGEYDRVMGSMTESQTRTGAPHLFLSDRWVAPASRSTNQQYSTHRQRVLSQGDIASLPEGQALMFLGADWRLVNIGMYFQHPVWIGVINEAKRNIA